MERIITELKDSIAKKNPDSLATLIQASSLTASFQGRQQEQLDSLKQQQQELTQAKADYELKLRSLRQEHEKVKIQYENRVQYSETQLTELSSPRSSKIRQNIPVSSLGVTSLGSGSTDTADNTESRIQ